MSTRRKSNKPMSKHTLPPSDEKEEPKRTFMLPDKHLTELSSQEEYKLILRDVTDRVIIFNFFAQWCGHCKILNVKLSEIAMRYKGRILIVKIDVDLYEDLAVERKIAALPTFIFMKDNNVVETLVSSKLELLEEAIQKLVGKLDDEEGAATTSTGMKN